MASLENDYVVTQRIPVSCRCGTVLHLLNCVKGLRKCRLDTASTSLNIRIQNRIGYGGKQENKYKYSFNLLQNKTETNVQLYNVKMFVNIVNMSPSVKKGIFGFIWKGM